MRYKSAFTDELVAFADFAAKASAVIAALALAWLLNGLLSGATTTSLSDPQRMQRVLGIVSNFSTAFQISACVCGVIVAIITFSARDFALALGAVGLGCAVGLPAFVHFQIGKTFPVRPPSAPEALLITTFTQTGYVITAAALIRGGIHLAHSVVDFGQSLVARGSVGFKQEASNSMRAKTPSLFTPCWKLPYCRDPVREICPAWHARKTCWKFGSGCYCDDDLIMKIILADPTTTMGGTAYMHAAVRDMKAMSKRKAKPPCDRCYIFLEHQRLKHNLMSPLVIPFSIGVMYLGYPVYQQLFRAAAGLVTGLWSAISYNPTIPAAGQTLPWLSTMESMFAIISGFFLLVYLTKALEFAIFKLRL